MTWERLGPREKQVLAILRRGEGALTTRAVHEAIEAEGADLAYSTVGTVLDRLVRKDVLSRRSEVHAGVRRYRYAFDPGAHAEDFVANVVEDVARVLGEAGLERLRARASAAAAGVAHPPPDRPDRLDGAAITERA